MASDKNPTKAADQSVDRIRECCKEMRISSAFADKALEIGDKESLAFLEELLDSEVKRRRTNKLNELSNSGGFPVQYSADQFDPAEVVFPPGESLESFLSLPFLQVRPRRNVIMCGKPGTGMSMLSIILGQRACDMGIPTQFFRTATLVDLLEDKGLKEVAGMLDKKQLLILDEFGYVPYALSGSRLLFNLISSFQGEKSIILNTCMEFSKWVDILGDDRLGSSFAGKIVDKGYLILFKGHDRRFDSLHRQEAQ